MTAATYTLDTVLTISEANRLSAQVAFIRTPSVTGKGVRPSFVNPEDRRQAELLIAAWRSER